MDCLWVQITPIAKISLILYTINALTAFQLEGMFCLKVSAGRVWLFV